MVYGDFLRPLATTVVCGLPGADRQRYTDKFKSLDIDKCLYEIPSTEWTDDPVNLQDGVDSITIESY